MFVLLVLLILLVVLNVFSSSSFLSLIFSSLFKIPSFYSSSHNPLLHILPSRDFHTSSQKSKNLHFDGFLLSKAYKDLDEKVQNSYVS